MNPIIKSIIIFLSLFAGIYIIMKIMIFYFEKMAAKSKTQLDDIVVKSIKKNIIFLCISISLYLTTTFSIIHPTIINYIHELITIILIIMFTLIISNIISSSITSSEKNNITTINQNIIKIIIFIIGFITILHTLKISITPILTTLGVGGIAVGMALQDTLSNLFAGIYIAKAKQMKIGDYIKLDSGEEGYITDINWRITKIRTLPNNIIIIPNNSIAKAIITNYFAEDKEMAVLVNVVVHYKSDLEHVEKITCQVGKEIMQEVQGGVQTFEPFIRYGSFNDYSISLTVILRGKEFVDQYLIKHEFIKKLHKKYKEENITIPYPIRAINYEQEKKI